MTGDLAFLDERVLNEWIVAQRWFASKTREVSHIEIIDAVTLRGESPQLVLCLVEARFPVGTHETYQVPPGRALPAPAGAAPGRRGLEGADDLRGRWLGRLRRAHRPGGRARAAERDARQS